MGVTAARQLARAQRAVDALRQQALDARADTGAAKAAIAAVLLGGTAPACIICGVGMRNASVPWMPLCAGCSMCRVPRARRTAWWSLVDVCFERSRSSVGTALSAADAARAALIVHGVLDWTTALEPGA